MYALSVRAWNLKYLVICWPWVQLLQAANPGCGSGAGYVLRKKNPDLNLTYIVKFTLSFFYINKSKYNLNISIEILKKTGSEYDQVKLTLSIFVIYIRIRPKHPDPDPQPFGANPINVFPLFLFALSLSLQNTKMSTEQGSYKGLLHAQTFSARYPFLQMFFTTQPLKVLKMR